MTTADRTFLVYALKESSPQFFGRIVLIAALGHGPGSALPGRRHLYSESYVLIERHGPPLIRRSLSAFPQKFPEVGVVLDEKFMLNAAYEVCMSCVANLVQGQFEETKNWALFTTPFAYETVDGSRLGLLRGLGYWRAELKQIADKTECHELSRWLGLIAMLDVTIESPLHP